MVAVPFQMSRTLGAGELDNATGSVNVLVDIMQADEANQNAISPLQSPGSKAPTHTEWQ